MKKHLVTMTAFAPTDARALSSNAQTTGPPKSQRPESLTVQASRSETIDGLSFSGKNPPTCMFQSRA